MQVVYLATRMWQGTAISMKEMYSQQKGIPVLYPLALLFKFLAPFIHPDSNQNYDSQPTHPHVKSVVNITQNTTRKTQSSQQNMPSPSNNIPQCNSNCLTTQYIKRHSSMQRHRLSHSTTHVSSQLNIHHNTASLTKRPNSTADHVWPPSLFHLSRHRHHQLILQTRSLILQQGAPRP